MDIAWHDKEANFAKVERLLDSCRVNESDLVLLPEMFDTGFSMQTDQTADADGRTLAFLQRLAQDLGVYVQGGRTIHPCHCTLASNVMTTVDPEGRGLVNYAKMRLFPLGTEPTKIAAGERVTTWTWRPTNPDDSLRVSPLICYDLRFPELFREGLAMGAECFALGACWLEGRHAHWRPLLVARAIENQAFVLAVNRVGRDPHSGYLGGSIALGPMGEVLGELADQEGVLSVEIRPEALREWRERFPAWKLAGGHTPQAS
jgi:omega-amidase